MLLAKRSVSSPVRLACRYVAKLASTRQGSQALEVAELRLICEKGTQLGIVAPQDALQLAKERGQKLVEVAAKATPPVWKLIKEQVVQPAAAKQAEALGSPKASQQNDRSPPHRARHAIQARAKQGKPPKVKEIRITETGGKLKILFINKGYTV